MKTLERFYRRILKRDINYNKTLKVLQQSCVVNNILIKYNYKLKYDNFLSLFSL